MSDYRLSDTLPEIPDGIVRACKAGELVIFLGAGVSRLNGSPSWEGLAQALLDDLFAAGHLTFSEIRQFRNLDPKKKLSIAKIIAEEAKHPFDFKTMLHGDVSNTKSSIFAELASIGAPIVTTNYDTWLDAEIEKLSLRTRDGSQPSTPPPSIYWKHDDLTVDKLLSPHTVMHLHGSVRDHHSMVISTGDYFQHYAQEYIKKFLRDLFGRFVVLFIGYSLDESEILEFIFRMSEVKNSRENRYWLYPCCSDESQFVNHIAKYYKRLFNIEIVQYYIDRVGYHRLVNVIKSWAPKLSKERGDPSFLKEVQFLDEALNK